MSTLSFRQGVSRNARPVAAPVLAEGAAGSRGADVTTGRFVHGGCAWRRLWHPEPFHPDVPRSVWYLTGRIQESDLCNAPSGQLMGVGTRKNNLIKIPASSQTAPPVLSLDFPRGKARIFATGADRRRPDIT